MAGFLISCFPERVIDFTGLEVGAEQEIVLADRVDVLQWQEFTMLLRVHSHSLASGAGDIVIAARGQSVSADDPGETFLDLLVYATVLLNGSTPSPAYFAVAGLGLGSPTGPPMIQVSARADRSGPGAMTAVLSMDISVKDA